MPEFLQNLLLGRESDLLRSTSKRYSSGAVRLMTLHGAKGLEFPIVFLCGLTRALMPLESAGNAVDIEEERRLFYVGMTRARQQLIMTSGEEPSRFLADIAEQYLQIEDTDSPSRKAKQAQLSLF